jgi:glycosyltransferase involved in cell wall biosynthesis
LNRTVYFATPTLFPLGNSGQLEHWCKILVAAGWKVVVGILHGGPNPDLQVRYTGTELRWLGIRRREWSGWSRLAKELSTERPSVLHFWDCPEAVYRVTRHFTGRRLETVFGFQEQQAWSWRAGPIPSCEWRLVYDAELLTTPMESSQLGSARFAQDDAGGLVTRSHRAKLRGARGAERERLVHKAPLDTHESREVTRARLRRQFGLPADTKFVVGAAAFRPDTDCKDLIWGIDQLKIVRDDPHLLLLGRGPQQAKLERFLSLTEVESNTHFLGERADGPEIVAAADIFWQADLTVYQPDGLLLALANGVPSVAAYGESTRDLVLPQQTAWVARPGARYEYARWSKFFLEEQERASQLSTQAREYVAMKFPLERLEQEVREIYRELQ